MVLMVDSLWYDLHYRYNQLSDRSTTTKADFGDLSCFRLMLL